MNIEISPTEYERKLDWYDGMLYCQLLLIDGKDDWRLPTTGELKHMRHHHHDFDNRFYYWASIEKTEKMAWLQYPNGHQDYDFKGFICKIRPVRTIE